MKNVKLFYLRHCPYCNKARGFLEQLRNDPKYAGVEIEMIEESQDKALADSYDYYYVPTFYVDEKKICEGDLTYAQVENVLREAMEK